MSSEAKLAFRDYKHPWKTALEKNGFADYSLPRPYRYAIPLTTLGNEDAKLMITYTTSMPGGTSEKGLLLFAKIPLD